MTIRPSLVLICQNGCRNKQFVNQELLVVKKALEKWRHSLEGAEQPFVVWTHQKTLEYVKNANKLNSQQTIWTLFLSTFSLEKTLSSMLLHVQFLPKKKTSNWSPVFLFWLLPVPNQPCSDFLLVFVTCLPITEGNTLVLMVNLLFFWMVRFTPLPKFPSANEMAEVLNVMSALISYERSFRLGLQFVGQFRRAFSLLIGATVSLSHHSI